MTETINAEATVKELVIAAGHMGRPVSAVAPPPWATKTEIDDDEFSQAVSHRHEFKSGRFYVGIENLIFRDVAGTDATIWWDSFDETGRSEVHRLEVNISDIPDLIVALEAARDVVENTPRVMERAASVDDGLQGQDI